MVINNDKATFKLKAVTLILTIIAGGLLSALLVSNVQSFLGQEKNTWVLVIVILYLLYLIYQYIMNHYFFYYSNEDNKLLFRFYPILAIRPQRKAIEIPKKDFHHYKISGTFFSREGKLILYQFVQKGIAKYPPISLTLLSKSEKQKLFQSLEEYVKKESHD